MHHQPGETAFLNDVHKMHACTYHNLRSFIPVSATYATFKAGDDLEEHHGGKQPVRKKGKVTSADNRWSKRFTWPDEVSTGHSTGCAVA